MSFSAISANDPTAAIEEAVWAGEFVGRAAVGSPQRETLREKGVRCEQNPEC